MKKHGLILALILIWVAICFLLILINQIIFPRPHQSYTSMLASYAIQKDMPAEVAVFLLGSGAIIHRYSVSTGTNLTITYMHDAAGLLRVHQLELGDECNE